MRLDAKAVADLRANAVAMESYPSVPARTLAAFVLENLDVTVAAVEHFAKWRTMRGPDGIVMEDYCRCDICLACQRVANSETGEKP